MANEECFCKTGKVGVAPATLAKEHIAFSVTASGKERRDIRYPVDAVQWVRDRTRVAHRSGAQPGKKIGVGTAVGGRHVRPVGSLTKNNKQRPNWHLVLPLYSHMTLINPN